MTDTVSTTRPAGAMPPLLRLALWGGLLCLFLIPVIAKATVTDMLWTTGDFVFAAVALGILGLLIEGGYRLSDRWTYRLGAIGAALMSFLVVWINLAVGFIGNENNPINQVYLAIPLVALAGGAIMRFRAKGMAMLMLAAAATHIAVPAIAGITRLIEWKASFVFAAAWCVVAALFWLAGRR